MIRGGVRETLLCGLAIGFVFGVAVGIMVFAFYLQWDTGALLAFNEQSGLVEKSVILEFELETELAELRAELAKRDIFAEMEENIDD